MVAHTCSTYNTHSSIVLPIYNIIVYLYRYSRRTALAGHGLGTGLEEWGKDIRAADECRANNLGRSHTFGSTTVTFCGFRPGERYYFFFYNSCILYCCSYIVHLYIYIIVYAEHYIHIIIACMLWCGNHKYELYNIYLAGARM